MAPARAVRTRRCFLEGGLALAGLGLLAGCGVIPPAQQPAAVRRIGFLSSLRRDANTAAFLEGLRERGYTEGQNIVIEWRFAEGDPERISEFAAELVRLNVEVIVARAVVAGRPASQATATIPIVVAGGDIDGTGFIANIARPGGNVTGLTTSTAELSGKRLELLKEAVPAMTRVAVLSDPDTPNTAQSLKETEAAARALRLELLSLSIGDGNAIEEAFAAVTRERAEALFVLPGLRITPWVVRISDLALRSRLPTMWEIEEAVRDGGLMAYGPNQSDLYRRVASHVDKILKGANPGDLPVERPMRFDFVINLKTAQALGLTIPQSVLAQATEVIQ